MYKTVLVREMIDDGAELLRRLDAKGIPVRAASWYEDLDRTGWKLVIVTSIASNPGPGEAYMQIQQAMAGSKLHISLDDIAVMSPTSQKYQQFKRTMEGVARGAILHPKDPSDGVAFDDAYVYRWLEK